MAMDGVTTAPVWKQVYEGLKEEITSGRWREGTKLPSMRRLGRQVGASHYPVQKAVDELHREGYVEKRQGSGTYVIDTSAPATFSDSVAVCMDAHGHVWGDLLSLLTGRLQGAETSVSVVDGRHDNHEGALKNLARSGIHRFVCRGHRHFPFGVFSSPLFEDATILGLVHWFGPELPGLVRVLTDEEAGGRMLARHVWDRGHRSIVVCAFDTRDFLGSAKKRDEATKPLHGRHGRVFLKQWKAMGGEFTAVHSVVHADSSVEVAPGLIADSFREAETAPTAIVGLRDVDALRARQALARRLAGLTEEIEVFGYFNTPWSRAADTPFTTVDLNLDEIADRASEMLESVMQGEKVEREVQLVEPKLVVR